MGVFPALADAKAQRDRDTMATFNLLIELSRLELGTKTSDSVGRYNGKPAAGIAVLNTPRNVLKTNATSPLTGASDSAWSRPDGRKTTEISAALAESFFPVRR